MYLSERLEIILYVPILI